MTNDSAPPRSGHSAVHLDNHVIIFAGGKNIEALSTRRIWMYNLYKGKWRKYIIPDTSDAPQPFKRAVAAAVDGTIYVLGGEDTKFNLKNELWTLSKAKTGRFTWSFIPPNCKEESSSPRTWHTGWEYAGNLWIFGGAGPSPEGYLNDHGTFAGITCFGWNNQLLCYHLKTHKWINPQCFGAEPSPRSDHACATIKDKVWIFGGYDQYISVVDDIFELTMLSLTWTQIQTGQARPQSRHLCTLTAITDNQLVLHCGENMENLFSDTWILDLTSHSWSQYKLARDHSRSCHASLSGLSSNAIIFGGDTNVTDTDDAYNYVFHVMLEPKCLQQLAMQIIHRHQDELPCSRLPMKLISLLGISLKEKRSRHRPNS